MSEDRREDSGRVSGHDRTQGDQTKGSAPAAKDVKKDRLAAALRENLKRRKAQISARRREPPPE
jgi:hypothetical protein